MSSPVSPSIGNGLSQLQALQARRAFETGRKPQQPQPEAGQAPAFQAEPGHTPALSVAHQRRLQRMMGEIQQIASQAGFVGLTDADVERAYAFKTSLLVDYNA